MAIALADIKKLRARKGAKPVNVEAEAAAQEENAE